MSDLQRYIEQRSQRDPEFAEGFESGYADFKIGVILEKAGLTQEQVANRFELLDFIKCFIDIYL